MPEVAVVDGPFIEGKGDFLGEDIAGEIGGNDVLLIYGVRIYFMRFSTDWSIVRLSDSVNLKRFSTL